MPFMCLMDPTNNDYLALKVGVDGGVEVIPDMDINITDLNKKSNVKFKHFFTNGYGGITFKVIIYIRYAEENKKIVPSKTDMWNGTPVKDVLHKWFTNMTPISIVTDAIDVPDKKYLISKNPSRKQIKKGITAWDLEFTEYNALNLYRYKNDNSAVLNAINKAKKANAKTAAKKASNAKKTLNKKLKKCNYKTLKYSKKKKVVTCVKYLQKVLVRETKIKLTIDGWYGPKTLSAVKKFQKKYNKSHVKTKTSKGKDGSNIVQITGLNKVLPTNGKIDKATFKALYSS